MGLFVAAVDGIVCGCCRWDSLWMLYIGFFVAAVDGIFVAAADGIVCGCCRRDYLWML
jgi:hypothetical protein